MSADTPENRAYVQKHRVWLLGEVITKKLIEEKPADPIQAICGVLQQEKSKPSEALDPPPPDVAADAKDYLQKHRVAFVVEDWLRAILEAKPEAPLDFSCDYFAKMAGGSTAPAATATAVAAPS